MTNIFDVRFIIVTIFGYPVSFVELAGIVSGMLSVYLTAREKISCWPIGIINILFFFILFFQVRLYSDMLLQIYFLVMSVFGWWQWTHPGSKQETDYKRELKITNLDKKSLFIILGLSMAAVLALGSIIRIMHRILPFFFPEPAAYPYPDALTTVFSITATVLMAKKKRECWLLWMTMDAIDVVIYFYRQINLVAIEYIIFGIIALQGYLHWTKLQKGYTREQKDTGEETGS